ncbi:hypothetical protein AKJ09_03061 [Labilithrix luteola]|uniref:Uncharacterized protein n=1 Tax=Labilithrix luteola TaxID=1391654 RepID=A0A0K1PS96_9BACT|nr:hypothetical protein AKJ09_03061 [Labilithrix luteola]
MTPQCVEQRRVGFDAMLETFFGEAHTASHGVERHARLLGDLFERATEHHAKSERLGLLGRELGEQIAKEIFSLSRRRLLARGRMRFGDAVRLGFVVTLRGLRARPLPHGDGGAHGDHAGVAERVAIPSERRKSLNQTDECLLHGVIQIGVGRPEDGPDDGHEARRERTKQLPCCIAVTCGRSKRQLEQRCARRFGRRHQFDVAAVGARVAHGSLDSGGPSNRPIMVSQNG